MPTVAELSPVENYLVDCFMGRDILCFSSSTEASAAADLIREQHPEIDVRASYNRVFIQLK